MSAKPDPAIVHAERGCVMPHTPEPWFVLGNDCCVAGPFVPSADADDPDQKTAGIAHCGMRLRHPDEAAANAQRIVACVNALQGIPTDTLNAGGMKELWNSLRPLVAIGRDEPDYGNYTVSEAVMDRIVNAVLALTAKGGA